jgi:hypothetical protein
MSKADWGYLLLTWLFVVWWFAARLDRLGRQLEYVSNRVRRETAELVGNKERATELREEGDQDWQEHKKAARQETIGFGFIGAGGLAWWWYTGALPFASLWHTAG